jgi:shikimate kinase
MPETVAARLAADPATPTQRPNLTSAGGIEELRDVLQRREHLYRETATICVSTDQRDAQEIADEILRRLPALSTRSGRR